MKHKEKVRLLSDAFIYIIQSWLKSTELAIVRKRNKQPDYVNCCATHDFCDSNVAMDDAFAVAFGRRARFNDSKDLGLINEAWDSAKEKEFNLPWENQ